MYETRRDSTPAPAVAAALPDTPPSVREPAPPQRPSLLLVESVCLDAARALIPDAGTLPSVAFASMRAFPARGASSAAWESYYLDGAGFEHPFSCAYDYESKTAAITLK